MAKTFFRKRTPEVTELRANTLACVRRHFKKTEKFHGQKVLRVLKATLILAVVYSLVEDYPKAEPLLNRCVALAKKKPAQNPNELFWASALLAEAYYSMNRRPEGLIILNEAKTLSRTIDTSTPDPISEALWHLAVSFDSKCDLESRKQGLAIALMALCWCVTRGLDRSFAGPQTLDRLRLHFSSYGIVLDEWRWVVKHANLTKYDFIGLLSIVLANADTAPVSGASWMEREPKVHVVR